MPTGCFPAATRLWSRYIYFFEVLHCFVYFVINYRLTLRFNINDREPG